jgi:hypothetical protein
MINMDQTFNNNTKKTINNTYNIKKVPNFIQTDQVFNNTIKKSNITYNTKKIPNYIQSDIYFTYRTSNKNTYTKEQVDQKLDNLLQQVVAMINAIAPPNTGGGTSM